jgi:hypothetical protein
LFYRRRKPVFVQGRELVNAMQPTLAREIALDALLMR